MRHFLLLLGILPISYSFAQDADSLNVQLDLSFVKELRVVDISKEEKKSDTEIIFFDPYTSVTFESGMDNFYQLLKKNLQFSDSIHKEGKVFVQFVVDTTGKMIDFEIILAKPNCEANGKEVIRVLEVINEGYSWNPRRHIGTKKKVPARMTLPILFKK